MKRQVFTLTLLLLGTLLCHAQYSVLNGDLNHDGKISIEDVTMMTDIAAHQMLWKNSLMKAHASIGQRYSGSYFGKGNRARKAQSIVAFGKICE